MTCAIVDGPDAWLAGPITEGTFTDGLGFFFRLHDGGRHGAGDWALQGYDAYEAQLAWCLSKDTSYDEPHDQFPMTSGDLVVKDK